jgi:hypothetical protein
MMMLTDIHAAISNAIPNTVLNIKLDPKDTDPMNTIELVKSAYMRTKSTLPFISGSVNISDISNMLSEYGVRVVYEGHADLPDMSVETSHERANSDAAGIDSDIIERINNHLYTMLGVSESMIDEAKTMDAETAASVVTANIMHNKQTISRQTRLEPVFTKYIQKFIRNSGTLMQKCIALSKAKSDQEKILDVQQFISAITVTLPRPEDKSITTKMSALTEYTTALDDILDNILLDGAFDSAEFEMLPDHLPKLRSIIRSQLTRNFIIDNNIMPEVTGMLKSLSESKVNEGEVSILETHISSTEDIFNFISEYMKKVGKNKVKYDTKLQKFDPDAEPSEDMDDDSTDDDNVSDVDPESDSADDGDTDVEPDEDTDASDAEEASDENTDASDAEESSDDDIDELDLPDEDTDK